MGTTNGSQPINSIQEDYKTSQSNWLERESKLKHQLTTNAWLRLLSFVGAFAIPFLLFENWTAPFTATFTVLLIIFLALVWRANKISNKRKYAEHRIALLTKELNCATQNWTEETDGAELIEPEHPYAHDLDLFGKGSLFQFINRTSTKGGYQQLAHKLKNISIHEDEILARQKAIEELASLNEFRQHYYALGAMAAESNKRNNQLDLSNHPDLSFISKKSKIIIIVFLAALFAAIPMVSFGIWSANILAYLFFIGLAIVGFRLKKINTVHSQVASLGSFLQRYAQLIKHVEVTNMEAPYLLTIKERLKHDNKTASEIMEQLAGHIKMFDQRLNMLLGVVLNGFFLWDLIVCLRLQKWYKTYGDELGQWLNALHELEAMNSLATFAFNHPNSVYPQLSKDILFKTKNLGHPLIPSNERVDNDFCFDQQERICVVTGANMAGKSTFLRTVGVAKVLAGNGCVVIAESFTYKPMLFITNMRAIDNLLKHESYFFAELSRLQLILGLLKEKGELFFILDEILKGTNSLDKYQGSMALIKQLLKHNGCGLVATHDLELGQLSEQTNGQVFNNCFEVSYNEEGLSFDYKLRTGVTQSHNATYLMEKMGLIPSDNVRH